MIPRPRVPFCVRVLTLTFLLGARSPAGEGPVLYGEKLDPDTYGPSVVEPLIGATAGGHAGPVGHAGRNRMGPPCSTDGQGPHVQRAGTADGHEGGPLPRLDLDFQGVIRGDAGSMAFWPDTSGAVGPDHVVEVVQQNFAVYDKFTGEELVNVTLGEFLPGAVGYPQVIFDQHSGRWFVTATDFAATASIYLAVSMTSNPLGEWFKTSFATDGGFNRGCYPRYPNLGVNEEGIYVATLMPGCNYSIFALDKDPLVSADPSLGTITAFIFLRVGDAIVPVHSFGNPPGQYFVARMTFASLELVVYRLDGPLTAPTLTELGPVEVPVWDEAPLVPALGGHRALWSRGGVLINAVYRDGSIWTTHAIDVDGRAACRWYEIDAESLKLNQMGTISDESLHYFYPSIMVNSDGDAVMGFNGADPNQYVACYYAGRSAGDPPGTMTSPSLLKEGSAPMTLGANFGSWGEYSTTALDPVDERTIWTIQ